MPCTPRARKIVAMYSTCAGDAEAHANRKRLIRSNGILAEATVAAIRQLGVVDRGVSLVEIDLRVSLMVDGVLTITSMTTVEPVSLVVAARAQPGARLDVVVNRAGDDVEIEW